MGPARQRCSGQKPPMLFLVDHFPTPAWKFFFLGSLSHSCPERPGSVCRERDLWFTAEPAEPADAQELVHVHTHTYTQRTHACTHVHFWLPLLWAQTVTSDSWPQPWGFCSDCNSGSARGSFALQAHMATSGNILIIRTWAGWVLPASGA